MLAAVVVLVRSVFLFFAYKESEQLRQKEAAAREIAEISEADAHFSLSIALQEKAQTAFDARDYLKSQIFAMSALLENPAFDGSLHKLADIMEREPESGVQKVAAQSLFVQSRDKTRFAIERSIRAPTEIQAFDYKIGRAHV